MPATLAEKLQSSQAVAPHVVIEAYAGTGKTFSLIVGVAYAFGSDALWRMLSERLGFEPQPSAEQQAIWNALAESRGQVKTVTYCAFNKSIVEEFNTTWGWLVKLLAEENITLNFATINSLGNTCVRQFYGRVNVQSWHTENVLSEVLRRDIREVKKHDATLVKAVVDLVDVCKLTLAGWTEAEGFHADNVNDDELDDLTSHFDIEVIGSRSKVYDLVRDVLARSANPQGEIDFNDQNWLPVINRLSVGRADLLLCDESQDLPRCKQEFIRLAAKRLFVVGDTFQAIYGYAGADVTSIPRMKELLGVETSLRLTETRRCSQAVVAEARKYVADFKAHEANAVGAVKQSTVDLLTTEAADADMVLCRVNAPLVTQALRFLKEGRKAIIRGRKFGESLVNWISKLKASDPADLIVKGQDWVSKEAALENKKKHPSETKIATLMDRLECITVFAEASQTVAEVIATINNVFAGKQCPRCKKHYAEETESCYSCRCDLIRPQGVLFSSIHRAKGLEAENVFFLIGQGAECPHPMAKLPWEQEQEKNLLYVGITRAKTTLSWCVIKTEKRKKL